MGNKREHYVHLVCATKYREDSIPPEEEPTLYKIVTSEARKLGCDVLAIGGVGDHVHVLVQLAPTVALSQVLNQFKGFTSSYLNDSARKSLESKRFRWQEGYGIFSVGRNQIDRVRQYILNQKERHASRQIWADWENTQEDIYQRTKTAGPEARP